MHTKKYCIYCAKCKKEIFYTDKQFKDNEELAAEFLELPDGSRPKTGDVIECTPGCNQFALLQKENTCLS